MNQIQSDLFFFFFGLIPMFLSVGGQTGQLARDGAKMQEKQAESRGEDEPQGEEDEATPSRDGRLIPAGAATSTTTIEGASSAPRSRNRPKREA